MENYLMLNDGPKIQLTEAQYAKIISLIRNSNTDSPFNRKDNQRYYYISGMGTIDTNRDGEAKWTSDRYFDTANYCTDRELMERRAFYEKVERNLWRFSMENRGSGDWYIMWDKDNGHWYVSSHADAQIFGPSFDNKEIAGRAIKEIIIPMMKANKKYPWELFDWSI